MDDLEDITELVKAAKKDHERFAGDTERDPECLTCRALDALDSLLFELRRVKEGAEHRDETWELAMERAAEVYQTEIARLREIEKAARECEPIFVNLWSLARSESDIEWAPRTVLLTVLDYVRSVENRLRNALQPQTEKED